eukprot:11124913-Lingulodinium_polyedra.AAC.1
MNFVRRDAAFVPLSYNGFRLWLQRGAAGLGFHADTFRTHSLRRGGATALALNGMTFADIMLAGRWSSERSCRLYVMKGEIMALRVREAIEQGRWDQIVAIAAIGEHVFLTKA